MSSHRLRRALHRCGVTTLQTLAVWGAAPENLLASLLTSDATLATVMVETFAFAASSSADTSDGASVVGCTSDGRGEGEEDQGKGPSNSLTTLGFVPIDAKLLSWMCQTSKALLHRLGWHDLFLSDEWVEEEVRAEDVNEATLQSQLDRVPTLPNDTCDGRVEGNSQNTRKRKASDFSCAGEDETDIKDKDCGVTTEADSSRQVHPYEDLGKHENLVGWEMRLESHRFMGARVRFILDVELSSCSWEEGTVVAYLPPDSEDPTPLWRVCLDARGDDSSVSKEKAWCAEGSDWREKEAAQVTSVFPAGPYSPRPTPGGAAGVPGIASARGSSIVVVSYATSDTWHRQSGRVRQLVGSFEDMEREELLMAMQKAQVVAQSMKRL